MRESVIALLMLAWLAACGRGGIPAEEPPPQGTIATLGEGAVGYDEFQRYLSDNTGHRAEDDDIGDEVKSSLLDLLLEERLLLRAAAGLGISVSEPELEAYLRELGVAGEEVEPDEPVDAAMFRAQIRRALILQKLKDEEVLSKVQVTDGEVDDYLSKRPDLLRDSRTLVLRQILVDDRPEADRLRQTLAAEPQRFEELAAEHSVAPDGGQARSYREEELPPELREPLLALQAGQVSAVLEHARRFLVFQMVRKDESTPLDRDDVRRRVRLDLFQQKVDQVLDDYVADLKESTEIHVNRSILPFRYVGEHKN